LKQLTLRFIAEVLGLRYNGCAWLITDILSNLCYHPELENLAAIRIAVHKEDNRTGWLIYADVYSCREAYTQPYEYMEAPDGLILYAMHNVLCLAAEV